MVVVCIIDGRRVLGFCVEGVVCDGEEVGWGYFRYVDLFEDLVLEDLSIYFENI